jgi:hypothetical protein
VVIMVQIGSARHQAGSRWFPEPGIRVGLGIGAGIGIEIGLAIGFVASVLSLDRPAR